MSPHAKSRLRRVAIGLAIAGWLAAPAATPSGAHQGPHQRPRALGLIDPAQRFPYAVLSGAGGHFHALAVAPALHPLLAGTHLGLFRSDDRGQTWRLLAPRFSGVNIRSLVRDADTGALYAATREHGVLESRDDGGRWQSVMRGLPSRDVQALALDDGSPRILYAWVARAGLFRREHAGGRWIRLGESAPRVDVASLAVHLIDPARLYVGTGRGVWLSENGGRHWHFPPSGLPHRIGAVIVVPGPPARLLAATVDGPFVGTPDGTGWTPAPAHPPWWGPLTAFAVLPAQPGAVFAASHEGIVSVWRLSQPEWVPVSLLGATSWIETPARSPITPGDPRSPTRGPMGSPRPPAG